MYAWWYWVKIDRDQTFISCVCIHSWLASLSALPCFRTRQKIVGSYLNLFLTFSCSSYSCWVIQILWLRWASGDYRTGFEAARICFSWPATLVPCLSSWRGLPTLCIPRYECWGKLASESVFWLSCSSTCCRRTRITYHYFSALRLQIKSSAWFIRYLRLWCFWGIGW